MLTTTEIRALLARLAEMREVTLKCTLDDARMAHALLDGQLRRSLPALLAIGPLLDVVDAAIDTYRDRYKSDGKAYMRLCDLVRALDAEWKGEP